MSRRNPRFYFDDILDAVSNIEEFTRGISFLEFEADKKTLHAVLRNLEIIGEACRQIPRTIKAQYPQIPWRRISAMRNVITHEYFGVDTEIAWKVCQKDIKELEKQVREIYNDIPDSL